MRVFQANRTDKQSFSSPEVEAIFNRPKREILQGIEIDERSLPVTPSTFDPANLIGNYLRFEQVAIQNLEMPATSTVLLANEANRNIGGGTGVVVNYKGQKYLVTATHVIGEKCFGKATKLRVYERVDNTINQTPLENMKMIYSSIIAKEKGLPIGDVAIFEYAGKVNGIEIGEVTEFDGFVGCFAIGYPAKFASEWAQDLNPLLSFGFANLPPKTRGLNTYVEQLIASRARLDPQFAETLKERHLNKVIFSGVTLPGNSGGGLYNLKGELVAVCRGPQGTIGKETGLREFYPIKKIFEELEERSIL